MERSKYTFLLPAYKAKFFEAALRSIKEQSFKDFRCLVSDDCSEENLKEIFNKVCHNDSRFEYRRNLKNIGKKSLIAHWNLLIDMCNTEYVIIASDDDIYNHRFLEEMDFLTEKFQDVNLFRARVNRITDQDEPFFEDPPMDIYNNQIDFLYQMYNCGHIHCIANYIFKTKPLKENGKFIDFPLAWFSDDATIIQNSLNGVCNSSHILFSFRDGGINISNEKNTNPQTAIKKIEASKLFFDWAYNYIITNNRSSCKLEKEKWRMIEWGIKKRVEYQIQTFYKSLTILGLRKLMIWMDRYHYIDGFKNKFIFFLKWI